MKVEIDKNKTNIILDAIKTNQKLVVRDLSGLSSESFAELDPNQKINLASGISLFHKFSEDFGPYGFGGCFPGQSLIVCKTVKDLVDILKALESIEENINENWTDKEKAVYLYGIMSKEFKPDPKFGCCSISSFLTTKHGMCTQFSMVYCELLRRQNIEAYVFASLEHAFNVVNIDGKFYPVDVQTASKKLNHFFGRKNYFTDVIEAVEIYDEATSQDKKTMDETYFEEKEIEAMLENLIPGYLEEKASRKNMSFDF